MQVRFKLCYPNAKVPARAHDGDAAFDLHAHNVKKLGGSVYNLFSDGAFWIHPKDKVMVGCGFSMATDRGWEAQVRPRSGLAWKNGIWVVNSPGTIDTATYRGEVCVILANSSESSFKIVFGDRVAQMVIAQIPEVDVVIVEDLDATARGAGGFGSTGV